MKTPKFALVLTLLFLNLSANEYLLEGKISYFRPTDRITREIMGSGALYGIEGTFQAYDWLYPWISVSIFPKKGHSIGDHNKTDIYFIPIGIGLKAIATWRSKFRPYVGIGMLPTYLHTHDHSTVVSSRHKWGFGGIFKGGCLIDINRFFIDLFADYTLLSIDFSNTDRTIGRKANLDGFSIGGGIGYRF
jgi:outer membrane protein